MVTNSIGNFHHFLDFFFELFNLHIVCCVANIQDAELDPHWDMLSQLVVPEL